MQEFCVRLRSFQEVKDFVQLSTRQPFPVYLENDHQIVNATSYMGLVSLDHSNDLRVKAECSETEALAFRRQAARFAAK